MYGSTQVKDVSDSEITFSSQISTECIIVTECNNCTTHKRSEPQNLEDLQLFARKVCSCPKSKLKTFLHFNLSKK